VNTPEPPQRAHAGETRGQPKQRDVQIFDQQTNHTIDPERYRTLALDVLAGEGAPEGAELAVAFVSPEVMAELNAKHMGHQGPTDVLAFPIDEHTVDGPQADPIPILLGDVVICPDVAADNCSTNEQSAQGHYGSIDDEIDLLVVHGILHVLGMDHADDKERNLMQASEEAYLTAFRAGGR